MVFGSRGPPRRRTTKFLGSEALFLIAENQTIACSKHHMERILILTGIGPDRYFSLNLVSLA